MFKNNKFKKYISSILSVAVISASLMVGWVAFGDDLVPINADNFPDQNWRTVVSKAYDKNGDGALSLKEREKTYLGISGDLEDVLGENAIIEDLKGIEYFTIQRLYTGSIGLKTLDVSQLKGLTQLTCQGNQITTLRLGSNNPTLTRVNCRDNRLTSLNVGGCYNIEYLDCQQNDLENIDLSGNSALKTFYCDDNELTRLSVSANSLLSEFHCSRNHLTELDLSHNAMLGEITQNMIGEQTVTGTARYSGSTINVPFSITNKGNVISTTLDTVEDNGSGDTSETKTVLGYSSSGNFFTKDTKNFKLDGHKGDTIVYEYNVNNPNCESMSVFVSVQRAFYQIDFYTNETKTELISRQFVDAGKSATAPTITFAPEDKINGGWVGNYQNVSEDSDVYVRWINEHIWEITRFDKGDVTIYCDDCGDEYSFHFNDVLNLTDEDMYFVPVLDVVKDNVLNAKDYAKLNNQFKK